MMIHDFDLVRFYLEKDEPLKLIASGSNISDKRFIKIKDYELASCIINSKKVVSKLLLLIQDIAVLDMINELSYLGLKA